MKNDLCLKTLLYEALEDSSIEDVEKAYKRALSSKSKGVPRNKCYYSLKKIAEEYPSKITLREYINALNDPDTTYNNMGKHAKILEKEIGLEKIEGILCFDRDKQDILTNRIEEKKKYAGPYMKIQ